ncbi:50S ribosomal protein L10 [Ornithinimicrobium sp. W1665]|uniref:50S ribosomal protein L10 n=1 Tax=Ornithinimicrobium sp. W1665 TaxID=3416666 RepID=UPI003CEAF38C
MATPEKAAAIAELTEKFRSSGAAVLTNYRGLTVSQLTELRGTMREHATYAVVKNTLTRRAAAEAGIEGLDEHLVGPTAIAFVEGDPVAVAKGLRDFTKANPALVIKAGVLDGKPLTPEEITKLADLESREVLLAKLAGAMKANLSKAASLFAAPLSQTARVVDALRAKVEEQGGPAAAPAEADAAPQAPAEDTTAEAPAEDTTAEAPAEDTTAEAPAEDTTAEAPAEDTTDVAEGGDDS